MAAARSASRTSVPSLGLGPSLISATAVWRRRAVEGQDRMAWHGFPATGRLEEREGSARITRGKYILYERRSDVGSWSKPVADRVHCRL